jgi:hypothetical protein
MMAATLLAGALHANFTMFDLAKDSMFIVRGEFSGLERTPAGDKLTIRCDEVIKGDLEAGTAVVLEAFEPAPADEALGREVIVCFNLINGKHYFLNHPFAQRSFVFETDDVATDGLDRNEQSLRAFMAINEPHTELIQTELRKRLELETMDYAGEYPEPLIFSWKDELLRQAAWSGTRAARDAAKALVDHDLFKGKATIADIDAVGALVPFSAIGDIERAYMLEFIRQQPSAHPSLDVQLKMLHEETSQACVGKLSNLMLQIENREAVLTAVGAMATDRGIQSRSRVNALQMLQALADVNGLPHVHAAITAELEAETFDKEVLRRAFSALRSTPDAASTDNLEQYIAHPVVAESWELTQRAWVAYSMINSEHTNQKLRDMYNSAPNPAAKRLYQKLLPENQIIRKLMIIHRED